LINTAREGISRFDAKDETRFVIFQLGSEQFGARIEHVKEVISVKHITPITRAQNFVLGVMNLRGVVCTAKPSETSREELPSEVDIEKDTTPIS